MLGRRSRPLRRDALVAESLQRFEDWITSKKRIASLVFKPALKPKHLATFPKRQYLALLNRRATGNGCQVYHLTELGNPTCPKGLPRSYLEIYVPTVRKQDVCMVLMSEHGRDLCGAMLYVNQEQKHFLSILGCW